MNAYVAVTDRDWFDFLSERPNLDEVNFWRPGGSRRFRALSPGEPLVFKLHAPFNKLVGWGFYVTSSERLPLSYVWDAFGEKNGVASLDEMHRRVRRYKDVGVEPDPLIGTLVLMQPTFLDPDRWVDAPADWSPNIVSGKTYDLAASPEGQRLWDLIMRSEETEGLIETDAASGPVRFREVIYRQRVGQGTFKTLVADAYERRCAVSGERVMPVLQAAHIKPVAKQGPNDVRNGLLLRSDIHRLFDDGYISVDAGHRLLVSRRLHADWSNGAWYYAMQGQSLRPPRDFDAKPAAEYLEWHRDVCYLG